MNNLNTNTNPFINCPDCGGYGVSECGAMVCHTCAATGYIKATCAGCDRAYTDHTNLAYIKHTDDCSKCVEGDFTSGLTHIDNYCLDLANKYWCLNIGKCAVRPTIYTDETHMKHCLEVGRELLAEELQLNLNTEV
jgi:hypothetical protein